MKRILIAAVAALALLAPTAAYAGPAAPIPPVWGGGSVSVDLPDFAYPAASGCFLSPGALTITGNDINQWDYYVAELTVTDSIGRISRSYYEFEEFATTIPLDRQLCTFSNAPGTYTITGTVEFNDYPYVYTAPVSDTFIITGYTPPIAAPTPVAAPAPAAGPSRQCTNARKALKAAKQKNKPYKVVQKAKKKVQRVC